MAFSTAFVDGHHHGAPSPSGKPSTRARLCALLGLSHEATNAQIFADCCDALGGVQTERRSVDDPAPPVSMVARAAASGGKRKPGRPKGAKNKPKPDAPLVQAKGGVPNIG